MFQNLYKLNGTQTKGKIKVKRERKNIIITFKSNIKNKKVNMTLNSLFSNLFFFIKICEEIIFGIIT